MLNMSLGFSHDVRNVHGVGKNLVDIILTKNGYRVVNSGIKQSIRGNWDCSVEPATGCNRLGVDIPMRQLLRRRRIFPCTSSGVLKFVPTVSG